MTKNNYAIRDAFGKALEKIGKINKKVVCISPDLKQATKLSYFFSKYPERSIETGIAEANAVGISAGLALSGLRPVLASFGAFLTGKNVEIRTSIAFNKAPVVLVGTHGGLIGPDGTTQAGLQDIAVMRSIPNVLVVQPSTNNETESVLKYFLDKKNRKIVYLRISREVTKEFFPTNFKFKIGKINTILKDSSDAYILTSGALLQNCYEAVKSIKNKTIGLGNLSSIKPIDINSLRKILSKTSKIITFEDHSVYGGLGSAVNEIAHKIKRKVEIHNFGIEDIFTQSGDVKNLYEYYKLDNLSIRKKIISCFN